MLVREKIKNVRPLWGNFQQRLNSTVPCWCSCASVCSAQGCCHSNVANTAGRRRSTSLGTLLRGIKYRKKGSSYPSFLSPNILWILAWVQECAVQLSVRHTIEQGNRFHYNTQCHSGLFFSLELGESDVVSCNPPRWLLHLHRTSIIKSIVNQTHAMLIAQFLFFFVFLLERNVNRFHRRRWVILCLEESMAPRRREIGTELIAKFLSNLWDHLTLPQI